MLQRVLEPETLDHLAPDDPVAQRSRRDLRRVNAFMGARGILERALSKALGATAETVGGTGRRLRIIELGCGDGKLMLDVARHRGARWPEVELDLLDRQPIVEPATIAAYAAAGWQARPRIADVLDWAAESDPAEHWDIVVANLFLHHFDADGLRRLLAGCARRADALAACEPRRSRFALGAAHLIFFLGANAVTRRDGVLSVRAGFFGRELSDAWQAGPPPGDAAPAEAPSAWRLDEYDDGLFTHCFCATLVGGRDR
ncbi:MAG: methyltransferase domain-containing protein [Burkholderiales bacterium]|nr:methyltransferase domain-containing protein [Burkholderiales bacterium]